MFLRFFLLFCSQFQKIFQLGSVIHNFSLFIYLFFVVVDGTVNKIYYRLDFFFVWRASVLGIDPTYESVYSIKINSLVRLVDKLPHVRNRWILLKTWKQVRNEPLINKFLRIQQKVHL